MNPVVRRGLLVASLVAATLGVATTASARTLSFAHPGTPNDNEFQHALDWWAKEINTRTDGSLSIEFHYLQSLVKYSEALRGVAGGVADIAIVQPMFHQERLPLWFLATTVVGEGDQYVAMEAWNRIHGKFPALAKEEKRNKIVHLAHYSVGPTAVISRERPYRSPEEFDGARVRMDSGTMFAAREAKWPVTPVNLPWNDIYSGLERGTIEGSITYTSRILPMRQNEVAKHVVEPGVGQMMQLIAMSRITWDSLTDKERKAFEDTRQEFLQRAARGDLHDTEAAREILAKHESYSMQFHKIAPEQQTQWTAGYKLADKDKLESVAKRAPEAKEIHAAYAREIEAVAAEVSSKGYPWK